MDGLAPIIDSINERITKKSPEKIVQISEQSGIYLHQNFLKNWNTFRVSNTDRLLLNTELDKMLRLGQQALWECDIEETEGKISKKNTMFITPLLKNDDRKLLASRIGMCYDWSYVFDLAEQRRDKEVEFVCSRDLFVINTIAYWCRLNNLSVEKTGNNIIDEYAPVMKKIFDKIIASNNVLVFPSNLSKEIFDQKDADKKEFPDFVKKSLISVENSVTPEKIGKIQSNLKPGAFI